MMLFLIIFVLIIAASTVAISVWSTYKTVKQMYSDVSYSWSLTMRRKSRGSTAWYCEYHSGIRIYDYFSLMIGNYPIFTFRRFDDPHEDSWTTYTLGFLVFFDLSFHISWGGKWLGKKWDQDEYENALRDIEEK